MNANGVEFAGAYGRQIGHPVGWKSGALVSHDQGIATHVFAAFSPKLKGMSL
jgi:hypothetical protein